MGNSSFFTQRTLNWIFFATKKKSSKLMVQSPESKFLLGFGRPTTRKSSCFIILWRSLRVHKVPSKIVHPLLWLAFQVPYILLSSLPADQLSAQPSPSCSTLTWSSRLMTCSSLMTTAQYYKMSGPRSLLFSWMKIPGYIHLQP